MNYLFIMLIVYLLSVLACRRMAISYASTRLEDLVVCVFPIFNTLIALYFWIVLPVLEWLADATSKVNLGKKIRKAFFGAKNVE